MLQNGTRVQFTTTIEQPLYSIKAFHDDVLACATDEIIRRWGL